MCVPSQQFAEANPNGNTHSEISPTDLSAAFCMICDGVKVDVLCNSSPLYFSPWTLLFCFVHFYTFSSVCYCEKIWPCSFAWDKFQGFHFWLFSFPIRKNEMKVEGRCLTWGKLSRYLNLNSSGCPTAILWWLASCSSFEKPGWIELEVSDLANSWTQQIFAPSWDDIRAWLYLELISFKGLGWW